MKKPVQVYITSVLKACRRRHYHDAVGNTSTSPAPATRTTLIMAPLSDSSMGNKLYPSRGNPCLDLFYNAKRDDAYPCRWDGYMEFHFHDIIMPCSETDMYLKQLLGPSPGPSEV
ncbi:unnamed protein product [Prunus brigantina]